MGGNDVNEPKRRETRRLDPRYVFFSCFSYFLILNYCSIVNIGSYIRNTTRTGPNDAMEGGGDENEPKRRVSRRLDY